MPSLQYYTQRLVQDPSALPEIFSLRFLTRRMRDYSSGDGIWLREAMHGFFHPGNVIG